MLHIFCQNSFSNGTLQLLHSLRLVEIFLLNYYSAGVIIRPRRNIFLTASLALYAYGSLPLTLPSAPFRERSNPCREIFLILNVDFVIPGLTSDKPCVESGIELQKTTWIPILPSSKHCWIIPVLNALPNFTLSQYNAELYPLLLRCKSYLFLVHGRTIPYLSTLPKYTLSYYIAELFFHIALSHISIHMRHQIFR